MPLTDAEKAARKARAQRRRELKARGEYVPRGERKAHKRKQKQAEARALQQRIAAKGDSEQQRKRRSRSDLRKGDWDPSIPKPSFRLDEPVLIKAMVTGYVHPGEGEAMRYTVRPIEGPKDWDPYQVQWIVKQGQVSRWPRKKKGR
jgi:hypothetical protein